GWGLGVGEEFALVGDVFLGKLAHLGLDAREILRGEGSLAQEFIKKAVLDRRADAELHVGKKLEHCRRKQVRGRVAEDFERLGVVAGEDGELGVALEWPGEIHELAGAVSDRGDARYQGLLGKSRGDFLRGLLRSRAPGDLERLPVRPGDLNAFHARLVALGGNSNVAIIHLTQANLSLA